MYRSRINVTIKCL